MLTGREAHGPVNCDTNRNHVEGETWRPLGASLVRTSRPRCSDVASVGPRPTFLRDGEFAGQGQGHDGMLAHKGREAPCEETGGPV